MSASPAGPPPEATNPASTARTPSAARADGDVFRALFGASPDALLVVDAGGRIVLANAAAASLLDYGVEALIGMEIEALVPDSIRSRHAAYRAAYGRQPRSRPMGTQIELVARRRDGSEVMVEIALSPLQNQGEPLVMAAIRDISAFPRVKQALQRAHYSDYLARLGRLAVDSRDPQRLIEQVPKMAAEALQAGFARVFLLEPDRLEFRVAGAFGPLAGEDLGSRLPNHPDTPPGFVLAQGRPVSTLDYRTEQRFRVPAAYLEAGLVSGLAVPLSDRGHVIGALAVRASTPRQFGADDTGFLESLSNLLATSLQRVRSEEALNHAERLESVGQLTGGIAHDFNNLLTIIQGNLQVLEELPGLAQDDDAQQLISAAARAARRGAELTGKLLAFSRRQVLQPSAVDVHALLDSLSDMLHRTLDQRIRIEVTAAPCPPCLADPGQLESALLNIAINARDAMPDGGTLHFNAEPCAELPDNVRGDGERIAAGGFVAISVSDSGSGMSDAVKEHVFEPFFTTKEAGRGTGLGLSTVYGFVSQSRGAVALDSSVGVGTTVTLYIPTSMQALATPAAERGDAMVPPGLHVLLVEDDAEVRNVVQAFLDALGCKATACASGEQALLALDTGAHFDLLLSDIALGSGMRGTRLAALAQQRMPGLGVLLMSGYSAELLEADRDAPPQWELLRKPYDRAQLARAIVKVVQRD